eukprot:jgi/Ulvmu1/6444/UM003_0074.1
MRLRVSSASAGVHMGEHQELDASAMQQQPQAAGSPPEELDIFDDMNIELFMDTEPAAVAPSGAAKKPGKRRITDARRERNRKAQTRYRWKCKEEIQKLEQRVESVQAQVQTAVQRRSTAQAQNEATVHRLNKATTKYIAIFQQRLADSSPTEAAPPTVAASASVAQDPAATSRALMASHSVSADSVFSPEAAAVSGAAHIHSVPCGSVRAIDTYLRCAPLSLAACKAHEASLRGTVGAPCTETALADVVERYKDSTASTHSMAARDTCWFLQSCYRVDGAPTAPCGVGGKPPAVAEAGDIVTFSSAFASDSCRLSFFVFFLAMSLEIALLTAEEDNLDISAPTTSVATDLQENGQVLPRAPTKRVRNCMHSASAIGSSAGSAVTGAAKFAPPPPPPPPPPLPPVLSSSASTAATLPALIQPRLTQPQAQLPSSSKEADTGFPMRCGSGDTCCAVTVTQRVFERIMADALAHMRHADAAAVARQFLAFLSGVLGTAPKAAPPPHAPAGASAPAPAPAVAVAVAAGLSLDIDSITEKIVPSSPESDMRTATVVQAAVDTVVRALRDSPSEGEPLLEQHEERRQRVAARYAEVTSTWGFSWLCLLTDAKRLSRALAAKSGGKHSEFDDLVDSMHVRVYKTIGLSNEQRRFLADFWATWLERRRVLDREFADALARADQLPAATCISPELLALLDGALAAPPAVRVVPLRAPDPDDDLEAPPVLPAALLPQQLLGASARATKAASHAVRALVNMLHRDSRQMEDFQSEFVLPQWFMTAAQRARLNCAHIRHACVPMEMLVVCRMAAMEQRRENLTLPLYPTPTLPIARTVPVQSSPA